MVDESFVELFPVRKLKELNKLSSNKLSDLWPNERHDLVNNPNEESKSSEALDE